MNPRRVALICRIAILLSAVMGQAACMGAAASNDGGSSQAGNADGGSHGSGASSDGAAGGMDGGGGGGGTESAAEGDAPSPDGAGVPNGLLTNVSPGGNFDLSLWELQEPVGTAGNPTTIGPMALEGPNGFHDSYFFTDATDGAMTFWDPESGVTTPDSNYPRSELREMNADGSAANWAIAGTNTLSASVSVTQVPDHVCIGQIHIGTAIEAGLATSTKPLLELFYYADGDIQLAIENSPAGDQTAHTITNVPLATKFSYAIELTGDGAITLTINGATSTFTMPSTFNGYGEYFKAGDYDQTAGTDASVGATVKFYALHVTHTT
jgi:hypothetical protein